MRDILLVLVTLFVTCIFCFDFQAVESIDEKTEPASFCVFEENDALSPEYDQRVSHYLKELKKIYPETQQDTMQEGKEFFTRLHDSLPFYVGMSKQDVYQCIKDKKMIVSHNERENPLNIFWNIDGEFQKFFSTGWIEISLKEDIVQNICVAPGNFSVILPGFLFDGEVFHKNEGENEGRN